MFETVRKVSAQREAQTPLAPLLLPLAPLEPAVQRRLDAERALNVHTFTPVAAQRLAVRPIQRAAALRAEETARVDLQRAQLQRQAEASGPVSTEVLSGALQRQQARTAPLPTIERPRSTSDWVTVMRQQAEQTDGQWMDTQHHEGLKALQRQVAGTLVQGYRQDGRPALARDGEYASHLAALQRHPVGAQVARAALLQMPPGSRPVLQRLVDETLQRENAEQVQDEGIIAGHALQRQLAELEEEAAQPVFQRIQARRGAGNPLPAAVQRHLEQGLNHDLSRVRIHDDAEAHGLAKGVNAVAFTTGSDIFFQSGRFSPNTQSGLELLAHETTHVVQQSKGQVGTGIDPDAGLEQEARRMGASLARNSVRPMRARSRSKLAPLTTAHAVQRQTAPGQAKPPTTTIVVRLESGPRAQLAQQIAQYREFLKEGKLLPGERQQVEQAILRASAAIRRAEAAASSGSSLQSGAGFMMGTAGVLTVDDATGIGVADDLAIPFALLLALGLYGLSNVMKTSQQEQQEQWRAAAVAVDGVTATIGSVMLMAQRRARTVPRVGTDVVAVPQQRQPQNRGRLQVQGTDLNSFVGGELSWPWTRPTPPTAAESIAALQVMKGQLSKRQLAVRDVAFTKAEARILSFQAQGGVAARYVKTFQNANPPGDLNSARVDIEVLEGQAFV